MKFNFCRSLIRLVISVWLLVTLNFFLIRALPGTPLDHLESFPAAVQSQWTRDLSLDLPLPQQYFNYLKNLAGGDFGPSILFGGMPTREVIAGHLFITLGLNLLALLIVFALAALLTFAGLARAGSWARGLSYGFSLVALSAPSVLLAPLLILLLVLKLNLFPAAFLSSPMSYLLPGFILAVRPAVYLAKSLTAFMQEELGLDYVRTARAKGLSPQAILRRHVLRNSVVPILNSLAPLCVALVSGSAFIEILFGVPGLGSLFLDSLRERDYFLSSALVLFFGVSLLILSHLFDYLVQKVDPRLAATT